MIYKMSGLDGDEDISVAAVVLAAGCSRRMGNDNKLLSDLDGKAIILHAVETVSYSKADVVIVVTGHDADRVRGLLTDFDVRFVHNKHYTEGLSTSLSAGIHAVPDEVAGALICLGDMPRVTVSVLDQLIEVFRGGNGQRICVPIHKGRRGNPVLWPRAFFPRILDVSGDRGARGLLVRYPEMLQQVEIRSAGILLDVDTPQDLDGVR